MTELPHNADIEAAILGAAMLSKEALVHLVTLTGEDFYHPTSQLVWQGISKLMAQDKPIDALMLKEQLDGSDVTLSDLLLVQEAAVPAGTLPHYIKILKQKTHERSLYIAANRTLAQLDEGADPVEVESDLIKQLSKRRPDTETETMEQAGDIDRLINGDDVIPGVPFGIPQLDSATGGVRDGEMCILAARTSIGKSAAAILTSLTAAGLGHQVTYNSGEMTKKELWYRMLAYWARVALKKFRDASFTDLDKKALKEAWEELKPIVRNIRVTTTTNNMVALDNLVRLEKLAGRCDFLVIDHAGRLKPTGKARSEYEAMSIIANEIKDLALRNNIPVLCLWQLSRNVEMKSDKRPSLADLRSTGQAEEVADTVLLLSRDSYYDHTISPEKAMVIAEVAKARGTGVLGEVSFPWTILTSRPDKERFMRSAVVYDTDEIPF